ncbi:N-acetylglucosamine-6-phosphate deacetylase [Caldanaerobius fijiensis DSM 17918]|uniref:N-acetylglucosamine-6-phosphate deacetylase n=1 Tax=Caldanaerobius fijiensis DSM 17918 TaxID=1121256 RepID=A0A1M4Y461_9THEO|nr:N-acetylglucosamine-6-phosphate deacetylase [Caldanaerobius fijiensis]SHF00272.1 N-acetylglucosamine-6-phosphate deacetylase [Caldanaerobius fijiensis DSM 17918]
MDDLILIKNGRVLTPFREIKDGMVVINNGKIDYVGFYNKDIADNFTGKVIDAGGMYISPGFIDIHTHGGGGHDLMDGTVDAVLGMAKAHALHGTTTIVPTTLTAPIGDIYKALDNVKEAKRVCEFPTILGVHLEGPYFSKAQKGAQDERYLRIPAKGEVDKLIGYSDDIVRVSAAPEIEGGLELGRYLKSRGIVASIGHSDATYDDVVMAVENGYTHVTHLYSGMSGVRRINAFRVAGVIESALLMDELTVEIIADGKHLPPPLLKLIYKIKGADKIALVTDSMRAAGMPEGEYILGSLKGGQKVVVEDGVAKLMDRSAFAGSVATADLLVGNMIRLAGAPVLDAVKMMTSTPAKIMHIDDSKGSLSKGKDADVVIFDDDINIKHVISVGKVIL